MENIILIKCNHCGKTQQTFLTKGILKGYKICVYCNRLINKKKNMIKLCKK